jgi:hypothetical protein
VNRSSTPRTAIRERLAVPHHESVLVAVRTVVAEDAEILARRTTT